MTIFLSDVILSAANAYSPDGGSLATRLEFQCLRVRGTLSRGSRQLFSSQIPK